MLLIFACNCKRPKYADTGGKGVQKRSNFGCPLITFLFFNFFALNFRNQSQIKYQPFVTIGTLILVPRKIWLPNFNFRYFGGKMGVDTTNHARP